MLSEKKTQDMAQEKRRNVRSGLVMDDQGSRFMLMQDGQSFDIGKVRDVSISGVGLVVPHHFAEGEKVALAYDSGDFQLNIGGTVIWCNECEGDNFTMGIEFDRDNRQDNALFFLAIRKYLDEFDGTYIDA